MTRRSFLVISSHIILFGRYTILCHIQVKFAEQITAPLYSYGESPKSSNGEGRISVQNFKCLQPYKYIMQLIFIFNILYIVSLVLYEVRW